MLNQLKPDIIQEPQVLPPIVQATENELAVHRVQPLPVRPDDPPGHISKATAASQSLAQMFGLDIRAAVLAIIIDLMVFGGDVVSFGLLIPLAIAVAGALGFIVYKIQIKWYGDDHDSALIKAMIVGLLTAIPVPLTPLIAIPGGILGIVNGARRK